MSDEFGQLLSEQKEVAISQGAVVSGQVIAVKEDEIVLNIGYKADAVISRNEFTNIPNANLCDLVKVLEALYTEKSGTAAETLKTLVTQVDSAMSQSSATVSDNAKAIIDGTKKPADVLMSGTYNFS